MRIVVVVALVVGLILAVAGLQAMHPPARDLAIPIYLGDPDGVEWARPSGGSHEPTDLHHGCYVSSSRRHSQVRIYTSHPPFIMLGVRQGPLTVGDRSCVSQRPYINAAERKLDE